MKFGLFRGVLLMVGVWVIAAAVLLWIKATTPTPEKLAAYLTRNELAGISGPKRAEVIATVASQLNRLTFDQRQELRESGSIRTFFEQLDPAERSRFLDLTLPEGFRQLMNALNKMDESKRKKIVDRILNDLRTENPAVAARLGDAETQKIITKGLSSFYEEADAGVKLDFAPVIEQLQKATQSMR